jgi:hypothetical protein
MIEIQKFIQRNSKRLTAFSILGITLLVVLSTTTKGPRGYAWEVTTPIPTQSRVSATNISLVRVDLGTLSSGYLGKTELVVGQFASHALAAGTLLMPRDIALHPTMNGMALLPLGLLASDISPNIAPGDFVDVYVIPKDQTAAPGVVVTHIDVAELDLHSRSLGGSVDISLNVTASQAAMIIDAESQGRLVVATDAF